MCLDSRYNCSGEYFNGFFYALIKVCDMDHPNTQLYCFQPYNKLTPNKIRIVVRFFMPTGVSFSDNRGSFFQSVCKYPIFFSKIESILCCAA